MQGLLFLVVVSIVRTGAAEAPTVAGGQPPAPWPNGVVAGVRLRAGIAIAATGSTTGVPISGLEDLFVGYRSGRFTLGVEGGFWQSWSPSSQSHTTSWQLGPAVSIALWRPADGATEAYVLGSLLLGRSELRAPFGTGTFSETTSVYAARADGGARYFVSPSLALGVEGGIDVLARSFECAGFRTCGSAHGLEIELHVALIVVVRIGT